MSKHPHRNILPTELVKGTEQRKSTELPGQRPQTDVSTFAITLVALAVIGSQIAAKAARDALFLSNFDITDLPVMIIAAAIVSILAVHVTTRLMIRIGPQRLVPVAFFASSLSLLAIWGLTFVSEPVAAVVLFLQIAIFGAVLISAFWLLVNEQFDPHTAKKKMGRIVAGATLGGLIGGVVAERVGAAGDVAMILPLLATVHLLCAWRVTTISQSDKTQSGWTGAKSTSRDKNKGRSALGILKEESYLRNIGIIVLLVTVVATILDYVYKAEATERILSAEGLMRFFAIYYTAVGLLTFLVQVIFNKLALQRLGLTKTISLLPLATLVGGVGVLVSPTLATATTARFGEAVLKNSLFRSGYELFFVPIPPKEKRATKTIIDVGFDRVGDTLGGGLIKLVLLVAPVAAINVLLAIAVVFSLLGVAAAVYLKRGYVSELERTMLDLTPSSDVLKSSTMVTHNGALSTLAGLDRSELTRLLRGSDKASQLDVSSLLETQPKPPTPTRTQTTPRMAEHDPFLEKVAALRSGDPSRVRQVIDDPKGIDPTLTPHVINLIAWEDVCPQAIAALRRIAPNIIGQLIDALLDSQVEFIIRRRVPKVLRVCSTARAVDGLIIGLSDRRFEVRYQCGRALAYIRSKHPTLKIYRRPVWKRVEEELEVDSNVWKSRRLLDTTEEPDDDSLFVDKVIRDRVNRTLEHVFTLLSLALEREPLKVAFRGLHTDDKMLRGTSLEYLDVTLPARVRDRLWPLLGELTTERKAGRSPEKAQEKLLASAYSIELSLVGKGKLELGDGTDDQDG